MEQRKPQSINFESIEQIQALLEQYFKAFNIIGSAHNFATKDDIKAVKDDIKAVKDDVNKAEQRLDRRIEEVKDDIKVVKNDLKNDIKEIRNWQIGTVATLVISGIVGILVKLFIH